MRAPESWPSLSEAEWRLWRDHLDRVEDPNLAALKREADCEITPVLPMLRVEVAAKDGLG